MSKVIESNPWKTFCSFLNRKTLIPSEILYLIKNAIYATICFAWFKPSLDKTRMHSSRMRTTRFSGRLYHGWGRLCLPLSTTSLSPYPLSPHHRLSPQPPLGTDKHLWKHYLAPNFVCGRLKPHKFQNMTGFQQICAARFLPW